MQGCISQVRREKGFRAPQTETQRKETACTQDCCRPCWRDQEQEREDGVKRQQKPNGPTLVERA